MRSEKLSSRFGNSRWSSIDIFEGGSISDTRGGSGNGI